MNFIPRTAADPDDIVRGAKITSCVTSGLLFLSGLFLIFFPNPDLEILRWLLGGNCVLMGGARIFGYFANDLYRLAFQSGFAAGGFCILLGVLIFFVPEKATEFLPYVVGIYILLDSMMKLQTAIDARVFGMRKWLILLFSAAVVSIFGIVTLLSAAEDYADIMWLSGVSLAVDGLENFWDTMYTVRVREKRYQNNPSAHL